jgi:hypothetical protein
MNALVTWVDEMPLCRHGLSLLAAHISTNELMCIVFGSYSRPADKGYPDFQLQHVAPSSAV